LVQSWHGNRLVKFIFGVMKTWNAPWYLQYNGISYTYLDSSRSASCWTNLSIWSSKFFWSCFDSFFPREVILYSTSLLQFL